MTASQLLAISHARMTPAAIAAHALRLAVVIESQERVIRTLYDLVDSLASALEEAGIERPTIDRSKRVTLMDVWPEIFSPETTS